MPHKDVVVKTLFLTSADFLQHCLSPTRCNILLIDKDLITHFMGTFESKTLYNNQFLLGQRSWD